MYWLVSLPYLSGSRDETWRALQGASQNGDLSQNYRFELPMTLRVGSLDTLMVLSDDLSRVNIMVEGVVNKIRRQANDLSPDLVLQVNSRPVASYMTNFSWDEAKYPLRKPLKEIVEELSEVALGVDDDLKHKVQEYQSLKQAFQAANRKTGGSLAVKDLHGIVNPADVVDTENLVTVIVTVPNYGVKEFMGSYEKLCDMVVPRSAKTVASDNDYALIRVILFAKFLDDFKQAARSKGCQTREFRLETEDTKGSAHTSAADVDKLAADLESKRSELGAWCRNSYGEAFSAWIHICAVRLFVESVLRYGLPPKFQGCIVEPNSRHEAKLRKALAEVFGTHGAKFWKPDESAADAKGDLFPYVSFTLDVEA